MNKILFHIILVAFCLLPKISFGDDGKCEGVCVNGEKIQLYSYGKKNKSEFKNGEINEFGTPTYPEGREYVGEFREGVRYGNGSITYPDGTQYKGKWLNGKPHGQGRLSSVGKFIYTGEFANGVRHGQGTLLIVDGITYVGQWANDLPNGNGSITYRVGTQYKGKWLNGKPHGQGRLSSVGKFIYTGEFANGVRHGQGTLLIVDGITYVGQWANDLPNGQGLQTQLNGMQISGEFKNGLMYGSGMIVMPDGNELKIKWDNALPIQKEGDWPGTEVKSYEDEIEWYMISTLGKTQKLHNQEPQQSASHMEDSLQDLISKESAPSRELYQSAVTPEKVSPQASKVDKVIVKDKVRTEAIIESQLTEAEKIKSEAITPVEKEDETEPKVKLPQNLETIKAEEYATIAVGANIRSDASLTSEVLRTVPPGYPVAVLERQADWLLVEDYRGRKGWVYGSLVKEPRTVIIKVFKGNLRSGPSLKDDIIVQLDHGTLMSVLERSGEWLKVRDLEELTGWLHLQVIWPATEMNE